ncbi:MAG: dienelactone hydrolase family protein [Deltaproteobacteria bacterium]|nr:dienelactone hydrolase family protein [Deltaproteobacteria bacterium]
MRNFLLTILILTPFFVCSDANNQQNLQDTLLDNTEEDILKDIKEIDINEILDKSYNIPEEDILTDIPTEDLKDVLSTDTADDIIHMDTSTSDTYIDIQDINPFDYEPIDISPDAHTETGISDINNGSGLYKSDSDPYSKGRLPVKKMSVVKGQNGSPVEASIYLPQGYKEFAVVIFQHGFLVDNNFYSDMLEHIASHGFVVVAPQMYKADGIPIGKPKSSEEAETAIQFYNWLKLNINNLTGVNARMDLLGLSGHSRGGKVIWTIMLKDPSWTKAIAGVDPVDGTGGPLGGETRIADKPFNLNVSSLIIGTGLGPQGSGLNQACAPEGDNHVQFYNASSSPAYHAVAIDYGHMDMLNDSTPGCGMVCAACKSGPDRKGMRIFTAAQLTAFFRYILQNDNSMLNILIDPSKANIKVIMENK